MRKRKSREQWAEHVGAWRSSGQTLREYCERHDLVLGTMSYWTSQIKDEGTVEPLVELKAVDQRSDEGLARVAIELVVHGRYVLRLWPGTQAQQLSEVIEVLERRG